MSDPTEEVPPWHAYDGCAGCRAGNNAARRVVAVPTDHEGQPDSQGACAWGQTGIEGLLPPGPHSRCLRPAGVPLRWDADDGVEVHRSFCLPHAAEVGRLGWVRPTVEPEEDRHGE